MGKNIKNTEGYTTVELIIAVLVCAAVLGFAIPTLLGFINASRAKVLTSEAQMACVAAQAAYTERVKLAGAVYEDIIDEESRGFREDGEGAAARAAFREMTSDFLTGYTAVEFMFNPETNKLAMLIYCKDGFFTRVTPSGYSSVTKESEGHPGWEINPA